MIICLKTRFDEVHIINWTASTGRHYTLCSKSFTNAQQVETFSADNIFPNMCRECYSAQEAYNDSIVKYDIRDWASDHVILTARDEYEGIQKGWANTETNYSELGVRYWPKAKRMRRKFPSKDKKISRRHGTKFSALLKRK